MKTFSLLILGLVSLLFGGMACAGENPKAVNALRVQFHMFSGRRDPEFLVTDSEMITALMGALNALPAGADKVTTYPVDTATAMKRTVIPSQQGYRGIRIDNVSTSAPDIPEILIHGPNVELHRSATAAGPLTQEFRFDADAAIEHRLLDLGLANGTLTAGMVERMKEGK